MKKYIAIDDLKKWVEEERKEWVEVFEETYDEHCYQCVDHVLESLLLELEEK